MKHKHNNQKFSHSKTAQQISRNLAIILQLKAKDPRLGMLNINEVRLTKDSSVAKVYFSMISSDNELQDYKTTEKLLNQMSGFLRTELATKISMRSIPELRFYYDTAAEHGKQIDGLLEQIKKQD